MSAKNRVCFSTPYLRVCIDGNNLIFFIFREDESYIEITFPFSPLQLSGSSHHSTLAQWQSPSVLSSFKPSPLKIILFPCSRPFFLFSSSSPIVSLLPLYLPFIDFFFASSSHFNLLVQKTKDIYILQSTQYTYPCFLLFLCF